jgi:uncharacterized membrane protein
MTRRSRGASLAGLAIVGAAVSAYLAAFELGAIGSIWDPLFGAGSERVLTSAIATLLPLPDALVGTAAYVVDAVLAVLLFVGVGRADFISAALGILSVAGALVGIALAVSQPLLVGTFCTLCLTSTVISILLAAGAVTEWTERRSGPRRATGEEIAR